MPAFALNHVTVANLGYAALLDAAATLGCAGVEVRNDLGRPLFDGIDPPTAGRMARDRGLRLLALAEVKRFDDWTAETATAARDLIRIAAACGAEGIALIPRNDAPDLAPAAHAAALSRALTALAPMLADHGLTGLVEPLGFATCALRHKSAAAAAIAALGPAAPFRIVHDTFHHALAGHGALFPDLTGIVHVSAVTDPAVPAEAMADAHRVLPGADDRLDSAAQAAVLLARRPDLPVSVECFAPAVHALADPVPALARSLAGLRAALTPDPAGPLPANRSPR